MIYFEGPFLKIRRSNPAVPRCGKEQWGVTVIMPREDAGAGHNYFGWRVSHVEGPIDLSMQAYLFVLYIAASAYVCT